MDGVNVAASGRGRRRGLPLSVLILRYFAYVLAAAVAIVVAGFVAFAVMLNAGLAYPANYGDKAFEETSAQIASLSAADAADLDAAVPSSYRWALFAPDGTFLDGDATGGMRERAREAAFDGLAVEYFALGTAVYERVALADGSVCVLAYEYVPQFVSKELRDALPNPQNLVLGGAAVLFVLALAGIVTRAARVIARKMGPLVEAAGRIEARELDFSVGSSGVREIDDVLVAVDDMRASLKESLEVQWRGDQERREQVAALAHDLKTPLTVVRGNLDVLEESGLTDDQAACAADAAEGARRMERYLAALIEVSRGGDVAFCPCDADLRGFFGRVESQARTLAAAHGVDVRFSEEELPDKACMDEALVERAIMNMIANAVEHAPAGSAVSIDSSVERSGPGAGERPWLAVSVADEGPGFSPEALRRGCEAFYQGDPSRTASGHGGLGLHVAAQVAARHGGSVELANRGGEGASGGAATGAVVTLRLPLDEAFSEDSG